MSAEESRAAGARARKVAPVESLADFTPAADRDPLALLAAQDRTRVPELVPVRHERMSASAFAFFRGAAAPMAADLAATSSPGLRVQLCGDAHLANFGAYASPARRLVFDLNDFDETLPGPFDWDVRRLVASVVVVARANGLGRKKRRRVALRTAGAYRRAMAEFASMPAMQVFYAHLDVEDALASVQSRLSDKQYRNATSRLLKARSRDGLQALGKLTYVENGERHILSDPPLLVPIEELSGEMDQAEIYAFLSEVVAEYARTLAPDRRHLVHQFRLAKVAHKVVGVGSVGTRAWILLMEPRDGMDPLLLQAKQANRSVLCDHLGESEYATEGERVVAGQRMMQATTDVLLGWHRMEAQVVDRGRVIDYYVRQLRDWKYGIDLSGLGARGLGEYGELCGWTLARAHARTGDRIAISTYVGETEEFDHALAEFGEVYADQTERDHEAHRRWTEPG